MTIVLPDTVLAWTHPFMSQTLPGCGPGKATEGTGVGKGFPQTKARVATTHLQSQRRGCGPVCSAGGDADRGSVWKTRHPLLATAPRVPKRTQMKCASVSAELGSCVILLHGPGMIHSLYKSAESHGMSLFLDSLDLDIRTHTYENSHLGNYLAKWKQW